MKKVILLIVLPILLSCNNESENEKRLRSIILESATARGSDTEPGWEEYESGKEPWREHKYNRLYRYFEEEYKKDVKEKNIFYFGNDVIDYAYVSAVDYVMYPEQDTCIVIYITDITIPDWVCAQKKYTIGAFKLVLVDDVKPDSTHSGWRLAYTINPPVDTVYCAEICMQYGIFSSDRREDAINFSRRHNWTEDFAKKLLMDNTYTRDCIYCDKEKIEELLKRKYWFDAENNY